MFGGSERSGLGCPGSAALRTARLEKGERLPAPPGAGGNGCGGAGGEPRCLWWPWLPGLCPGGGSAWPRPAAPGAVPPLSLCFVSVPDGGDAVCAVLRAPLPGAPWCHHLLCLLLPLLLHRVPGDAGAAGRPLPGVQAHVSQQVRAPGPPLPALARLALPPRREHGVVRLWLQGVSQHPPRSAWCLCLCAPALHEQLQRLPPSMRF